MRYEVQVMKKNKIMKDLIRSILLIVAIYSGTISANSQDFNIIWVILCGIACSVFVSIKDKKKD